MQGIGQMEEIFIECRDLSIGYVDKTTTTSVIKSGLFLHAFRGELIALIGGNGIGKSTLLRTIAGFQKPVAGELCVRHRSAQSYRPEELAREMSFVSTEIVRVTNLSVSEMVGLGRYPYTNWLGQLDSEDHHIISEAILQVGLSGYENRMVNRISDGERQRAMIARALAQDTRIMVMDEPTAFLDISNKYEIVRILHNLAQYQDKCIIYSTHDLNTALLMADRIWLMLTDRVVEGMPEELAALGCFEALFSYNPHLFFDTEKGDFRIRKETRGTIYLFEAGTEHEIATKALERLGFLVKELSCEQHLNNPVGLNEPDCLVVGKVNGLWNLTAKQECFKFQTLEQLIRALKKVIPPPES